MTTQTSTDSKTQTSLGTSIKDLFDNNVHIGHRTTIWNPKMRKYIYTQRNGIHIIDLNQTVENLKKAKHFLKALKLQNKKLLIVGTKPQVSFALQEKIAKAQAFYIDQKWQPGLLTNFKEIRKRIDHYLNLKSQFETNEINKYTKKEVAKYKKELDKLEKIYHGVAEMRALPGAILVLDALGNRLTIEEAQSAKIPVLGVVDTNTNPDGIDIQIPANDDSIKSICLLLEELL